MSDYYEILGVARDATSAQIKSAFRKKSKKHHSDAGGSDEAQREVNEAYEVLGDAKKREQYDKLGMVFDLDEEARQCVTEIFEQMLSREADKVTNPMEGCREVANTVKETLLQRQGDAVKTRGRLERWQRRFRRKAEAPAGADIFTAILQMKLLQVEGDLAACKKNLAINDRVFEMLEDYENGEPVSMRIEWGKFAGTGGGGSLTRFPGT